MALGLNYVSVEADENEGQSVKIFPYPVMFYHRNVNEFLILKCFGLTHAVSRTNNLLFENIDKTDFFWNVKNTDFFSVNCVTIWSHKCLYQSSEKIQTPPHTLQLHIMHDSS